MMFPNIYNEKSGIFIKLFNVCLKKSQLYSLAASTLHWLQCIVYAEGCEENLSSHKYK